MKLYVGEDKSLEGSKVAKLAKPIFGGDRCLRLSPAMFTLWQGADRTAFLKSLQVEIRPGVVRSYAQVIRMGETL